jgi:hypothetical protein
MGKQCTILFTDKLLVGGDDEQAFTLERRRTRHVFWILLVGAALAAGWAQAAAPAGTVRIHYNRTAGDYTGWAVYTWNGALNLCRANS